MRSGVGRRPIVLGRQGGELVEVVRALDAEGLRPEQVQVHAPTLDDVFLAKTGRKLEGEGDEALADAGALPVLEPNA